MATDLGLFASPEDIQRARSMEMAKMNAGQLAGYMGAQGGAALGQGLGNLFGVDVRDETMKRADKLRELGSQYGVDTAEGLDKIAAELQKSGDLINSMALRDKAASMRKQSEDIRKAKAEADKAQNQITLETNLRDALSKLPENATDEEIMKVVTKYGSADKVLATLQAAQSRKEAITAADARAKEANATRLMIAQMQNDTKQLMSSLMIGMKQGQLDEKSLAEDQKRLGAIGSFDTAITSLEELNTHPGKSAAVGMTGSLRSLIPGTDAYGFKSKLEAFKAQTFIPMVSALKGMGALSDAEGKKLTDAVGALDQGMKESEFNAQVEKIKQDLKVSMERAKMSVKNQNLIKPFMDIKNKVAETPAQATQTPPAATGSGWSIKVKQP